MNTIVYLIRHSANQKVNNLQNHEPLQLQNEKTILSIEGEQIAQKKFKNKEFSQIDILFSSNYTRAIATAKYLAENNNLVINIIEDFGETKYGVTAYEELPEDFEQKQFIDENYKMPLGESQKEVRERMSRSLMSIIKNNAGKNIAIVSHSTSIAYLIGKWCEIHYDSSYKFHDQVFFDGKWTCCQTFKLVFADQKLIDIQVI